MTSSTRQVQVIILVGRDGCSWKRVAQVLGISTRTAREYGMRALERHGIEARLRVGLHQLYRQLEEHLPE